MAKAYGCVEKGGVICCIDASHTHLMAQGLRRLSNFSSNDESSISWLSKLGERPVSSQFSSASFKGIRGKRSRSLMNLSIGQFTPRNAACSPEAELYNQPFELCTTKVILLQD